LPDKKRQRRDDIRQYKTQARQNETRQDKTKQDKTNARQDKGKIRARTRTRAREDRTRPKETNIFSSILIYGNIPPFSIL
jgi:hypothetical protein